MIILTFLCGVGPIFNYQNSEKFVYDDEDKCDLLNKYFSFISKSRYRIDKNNNIADLNVSIKEISDIIRILHANKASEPDVISHKF
jgi:transposase-like protein